MKRLIAIPLMFLYLISTSGTMLQLHFCNQKIESWSINTSAKDDCFAESEMANTQPSSFKFENQSCCSDQTVIVKTITDQISPTSLKILQFTTPAIVPNKIILSQFQLPSSLAANVVFDSNAPPGLWQEIPLFKLHQRFTYYG